MLGKLIWRMATQVDPRCLAKFVWGFGVRGGWSLMRWRKRLKHGKQFPPFLFISITSVCNLRCQGCWAVAPAPTRELDLPTLDRIINDAKTQGCRFFGLLGGEPLLHRGLLEFLGRHRDCYFQLFTNGTLLTDDVARELRRLGNVTPLVSIEGDQDVSDVRRGGREVLSRTFAGLDACRRNRLLTGAATSLCASNIDALLSEDHIRKLIERGVHYIWYYLYRPAGPDPHPELALSSEQVVRVRKFLVEVRTWAPAMIVDAYWDADGQAICPAAAGVSFHISPGGDVEPCPPIQLACQNVAGAGGEARRAPNVVDAIEGSAFIRDFRKFAPVATPGCVIMTHPDKLREFAIAHGAHDSSGRGTCLLELEAMTGHCSQEAGSNIPERHWFYKIAKQRWFFGLGAYA